MPVFQCEKCGCVDNTATSNQMHAGPFAKYYDWTGREEDKGKKLCKVCGPTKHSDGDPVKGAGKWHNYFDRQFLPLGEWETDPNTGNLRHKKTHATNYLDHRLPNPESK